MKGKYVSDEESSDVELTFDELATSYRELCLRSAEVCQEGEKQKALITQLKAERKEHLKTISSLENEVSSLNSNLDRMVKSFKMLNNGSDTLD